MVIQTTAIRLTDISREEKHVQNTFKKSNSRPPSHAKISPQDLSNVHSSELNTFMCTMQIREHSMFTPVFTGAVLMPIRLAVMR